MLRVSGGSLEGLRRIGEAQLHRNRYAEAEMAFKRVLKESGGDESFPGLEDAQNGLRTAQEMIGRIEAIPARQRRLNEARKSGNLDAQVALLYEIGENLVYVPAPKLTNEQVNWNGFRMQFSHWRMQSKCATVIDWTFFQGGNFVPHWQEHTSGKGALSMLYVPTRWHCEKMDAQFRKSVSGWQS